MNSRSLLFARYQSSSPKELKILPFFSVWLRRARGFESLSRTLLSSRVPPREAWLRTLLLTSLPRTRRIKSSSVAAGMYMEVAAVDYCRASEPRPIDRATIARPTRRPARRTCP